MIDSFVIDRYESLAGLVNRSCRDKTKADDIISYLTDRLYSGGTAVALVIAQGMTAMESWCKRVIYTSIRGHNDRMMAGINIVSRRSRSIEEMSDHLQDGSDAVCETDWMTKLGLVEFQPEFEFFFGSFFELELIRSGYDLDDIDRRLRLQEAINSLSPWQLQLYKLYYEQKMTHRDIAKLKKMPKTSVYNLLIELRQRLNELLNTNIKRRYLY